MHEWFLRNSLPDAFEENEETKQLQNDQPKTPLMSGGVKANTICIFIERTSLKVWRKRDMSTWEGEEEGFCL